MELVAVKASAQQEISALKAQNAAMLACGRSLDESNTNIHKMLAMAEASLVQASAVTSSMVAEGRTMDERLGKAEAEVQKTNVQLSTVMAMAKAKVDMSSFPLAQWVATVCHEVQVDLDLDQLGQTLATGGAGVVAGSPDAGRETMPIPTNGGRVPGSDVTAGTSDAGSEAISTPLHCVHTPGVGAAAGAPGPDRKTVTIWSQTDHVKVRFRSSKSDQFRDETVMKRARTGPPLPLRDGGGVVELMI